MPCANVFGLGGVGAFAQSVRDLDALFRGEGEVLANIPRISLAEVPAFFHHALHESSVTGQAGGAIRNARCARIVIGSWLLVKGGESDDIRLRRGHAL